MNEVRLRAVALTAVAAGILFVTTACTREETASKNPASGNNVITVAVAKVERMDLSQNLRVAGEFRPYQEIDVHAKVPGFVKEIYVDVGSRVKKRPDSGDSRSPRASR